VNSPELKGQVREFWDRASCGEELLLESQEKAGYLEQMRRRYELEPYIEGFARFGEASGKDVLEIGVGLGADHQRFAQSGAKLCGIDLTDRAISHTARRLGLFGLSSRLAVGDAENLPFHAESFDIVYSWGVIHHSPDTPRAAEEIRRVLRPGGMARVMIYHRHSLVGYMLWVRYGLLAGRPSRSLDEIYAAHLESPGTKTYSPQQARVLFSRFAEVKISTVLTHGDLLESGAGQRHKGVLLTVARAIWPRWLLRRALRRHGLFMLVEARR
jgi:SAM-dependent methyltransferase